MKLHTRSEVLQMLHIFYGSMDGVVMKPSIYFKNTYQPEWLMEARTKEMIRDVDKSEVVGPNLIQSPVLGPIPPERLSGGVKTLILISHVPEKIFNASKCGDNCAKWLLQMGKKRDIPSISDICWILAKDSLKSRFSIREPSFIA